MSTTVKKIAQSALFQQRIPLVAGSAGLERDVKYVTICNSPILTIPDFNLGDSVFVLTSFSPYYTSTKHMEEVIHFLKRQNVAALCVKVDSYLGQMPQELISLCDQVALPLFSCNDKSIPFRQLIREIDQEIIGGDIAELEHTNQQYAMLYDTILSGETVDANMQRLGSLLGCACMAVSCGERILGCYNPDGTISSDMETWREFARKLIRSLPKLERNRDKREDSLLLDGKRVFFCRVHKNVEGFLIFGSQDFDVSQYRAAIENAVTFISVKLLESMMLTQSQLSGGYRAVEFLFQSGQDEETIRHKLMLFGINSIEVYRIIGFSCGGPESRSYLEWQHKWVYIQAAVARLFPDAVCFNVDNFFAAIVFFKSSSKYNNDAVMKETLAAIMQDEVQDPHAKAAFSGNSVKCADFSSVFQSLRKKLRYAFAFAGDKQVLAHNDMQQVELVASIMKTREYETLRETIIKPLREHDELYKSELWDTLRTCLEFDNLGDAANSLFIHKSTLRYRLQKINAITGQNYFTSVGKFMLQVANIAQQLERC